jgi:hypothetical protein
MERRGYLALVGSSITVGLAGCGGTDQPDDETTTAPGGTQPGGDTVGGDETTAPEGGEATTTTETTTEEPTTEPQTTETQTTATEPTTAPGDVSTVVIEGSIFAGGGPGAGPGKHVEVTITNEGDAASGEVTITVEWYDENGTLVATSNETAPRLGPRGSAGQAVAPPLAGAAAGEIRPYAVCEETANSARLGVVFTHRAKSRDEPV